MAESQKVLVVDDEVDVCAQIAEELEDAGFEVTTSATYADARAKLQAGGYKAAILDIMGVQGQDLLAQFGEKLPCIMLTANALSKEQLKLSLRNRAALYLPKEELGHVSTHVTHVLEVWEETHRNDKKADPRPKLWKRLFRVVNFIPFFGEGWWKGDDFFKGFELSGDDVDHDLSFGRD